MADTSGIVNVSGRANVTLQGGAAPVVVRAKPIKAIKPRKPAYYIDFKTSGIKACRSMLPPPEKGESFYHQFVEELKLLLERKRNNVYKWFHQPFYTPDGPSGESRWADIVAFGHTQTPPYLLPTLEAQLVQEITPFLANAFSSLKPFGIMAGLGTEWAVGAKEIPTHRATNASGVAAWDIMLKFAENGAQQVAEALHVPTYAHVGDFTKPFAGLENIRGKQPTLITMFGSTLGNDIDLTHVPKNFADTIDRKGFFLVTIDSAENGAAVGGYENALYTQFQEAYWQVARYMVGDRNFDPAAIKCKPYYETKYDGPDDHYRATIHRHTVVHDTSITIDGKKYPMKAGEDYLLGRSHKWFPEDLEAPFAKAGWEQMVSFKKGTAHAVLFMGVDTPQDWKEPVLAAIAAARSQGKLPMAIPKSMEATLVQRQPG